MVPIAFAIVVSVLFTVRTNAMAEEHKCYWIMSMVLLFPLSTMALLARIIWGRK